MGPFPAQAEHAHEEALRQAMPADHRLAGLLPGRRQGKDLVLLDGVAALNEPVHPFRHGRRADPEPFRQAGSDRTDPVLPELEVGLEVLLVRWIDPHPCDLRSP
jgi:hypothetical protein